LPAVPAVSARVFAGRKFGVLASLKNIFKVPELRGKVLFTLAIVAVYRFGAFVPVPGVDLARIKVLAEGGQTTTGNALQFLQLFSGNALSRLSLFALGIMPYITASIIMQILAVVIPKLEQWQEQGAVGQRKITQWTRYVTIAISIMQATGLAFVFHNNGGGFGQFTNDTGEQLIPNFDLPHVLLIVMTLTTGTALLMWLGEVVTQKGIGNGMSLLIFASVVSTLPSQGVAIQKSDGGTLALIGTLAIFAVLLIAIVFVEQGQRRIPVQFAKRVVGRRMYGGQSTYIPLKVNQSGVIPIIFASSVLYLPQLLAVVLPADKDWAKSIQEFVDSSIMNPRSPVHLAVFGLLIVLFAYFYTAITFAPDKQADTIRKQGGFIPGIRPGPQTERYLQKILSRITLPGALFLAVIALIPSLLLSIVVGGSTGDQAAASFGGISILIAVGVALETMKQIDSQLMMRNYEGFLK
jgi:preprotein translocase subunit SecY